MKKRTRISWIAIALLGAPLAGCSDDNSTESMGAGIKQTSKNVVQTTKEVGSKVGDELSVAAEALERFAKDLASNVSESAEDLGRSIEAKMPDVESLVEKSKSKLNVGSAEAKLMAAKLDDQLLTLKNKLADLTRDGAQATQEAKDDAVDAFQELAASIKDGLATLHA